MKTLVPMLTINKLTAALDAIRSAANNAHTAPDANLNLIYVIANEKLKETAEEIETIKREARRPKTLLPRAGGRCFSGASGSAPAKKKTGPSTMGDPATSFKSG